MKKLFILLMLLALASPAWSADEWLKTRPATTGDQWTAWPTASQANNSAIDRLVSQYPRGISLEYATAATITATTGGIVCSNSDGSVRKFRNNTSTTTIAWTDIDTGVEESSKQFFIYGNCDADATTATFKISASATAPTGITYYKRIGSFYNDASSNITQIVNDNLKQIRAVQSKSLGTTYQALTDGFVVASLYSASDPARQLLKGYTDSASAPTTLVSADSLYQWTGGNSFTESASVFFPVKTGDYYKVVQTSTEGSASSLMYFIPNY